MQFSSNEQKLLRIAWLLAIIAVIVGSLLPDDSVPLRLLTRLQISDKVQHFTAYVVLAILPALHEKRTRVLTASIIAVALGIALEFAQLYSVRRLFEVRDMAANILGVGAGLTLGLWQRGESD
jgi:VanZ family protein